jgi:hypothetical protein
MRTHGIEGAVRGKPQPHFSLSAPTAPPVHFPITLHRSKFLSFQINVLNLVGKIGLPSGFGENSPAWRENAETFRLSTLKVAIKSFVFKGVSVVAWALTHFG